TDTIRKAAEQKKYSADLFFHQHAAAEQFEVEDRGVDDVPHYPSRRERDRNLKNLDVPAGADDRSPWLLFDDPASLRREVTATLLRSWPQVPDGATLSDPRAVQALLTAEKRIASVDPRYDGRPLRLSENDLHEIVAHVRFEPWDEERLDRVNNAP